ncbi:hypothetical protein ACLB2K_002058 [Fragaria x ananassa]
MERTSTLGLKYGRPSILHPPTPATARLHPKRLHQRPRPLSLLGESIHFQFSGKITQNFKQDQSRRKLEKNGLVGEGKWSGTLLDCSGVEARHRRRQRVKNRRTSAL